MTNTTNASFMSLALLNNSNNISQLNNNIYELSKNLTNIDKFLDLLFKNIDYSTEKHQEYLNRLNRLNSILARI